MEGDKCVMVGFQLVVCSKKWLLVKFSASSKIILSNINYKLQRQNIISLEKCTMSSSSCKADKDPLWICGFLRVTI